MSNTFNLRLSSYSGENAWNTRKSFQWHCRGKDTDFLLVSLFKSGQILFENCDCSDDPFTSHTKETTRKSANHQRKTTNYNFGGRWLVWPPLRNIPASLGRELEHAAIFVNLVLCCSTTSKSGGNL
jgi:hypothetical protein